MVQLTFNDKQYQQIIDAISMFKEIDGDDQKSLELEDFYGLAEMARSIIGNFEEVISNKND
jgi:hypothetical protein